jgi:hypothetical protein
MGFMISEQNLDRRSFLVAASGLIAATPMLALAEKKEDSDKGVTATEDLMKEHGVLNRCLLIYEEGMRRVKKGDDIASEVFSHTAQLIRKFVEEYHEQNEEKYFPGI